MRKAFIAVLTTVCVGATLTLALPQASHAQPGQAGARAGKHTGGGRLEKMAAALGLTDAQKAQIKPILKSAAAQVKAVRQNTSLSPADRKAKIKDIRQSTMPQILAILTPAQKQKMAAMHHHAGKRAGKAAQ